MLARSWSCCLRNDCLQHSCHFDALNSVELNNAAFSKQPPKLSKGMNLMLTDKRKIFSSKHTHTPSNGAKMSPSSPMVRLNDPIVQSVPV